MNLENIFLLSFGTDLMGDKKSPPIEFNIIYMSKNISISRFINKKNNDFKTSAEFNKKELTINESIVFLNKFCEKTNTSFFYSSNYIQDFQLLKNLKDNSLTIPNFSIKDFYIGINSLQKTLWKHLYEINTIKYSKIQNSAEERNKNSKLVFNKILEIKNINSNKESLL